LIAEGDSRGSITRVIIECTRLSLEKWRFKSGTYDAPHLRQPTTTLRDDRLASDHRSHPWPIVHDPKTKASTEAARKLACPVFLYLTGDYLWRSSAKIGAGKFR